MKKLSITAAETGEVHKHWNRTRVQNSEQRSQEKDEGSRGRVDWVTVQEHRERNDIRKQQRGLMALAKTQQHKSAVIEDGSGNIMMESTAVLNWWTTMNSILTLKKKKKIWNRVDCQCFEKKIPKVQKKLKRTLFNQTKQGHANFQGNPLFQSYIQCKHKQITYLVDNIPSELLKNGGEATTTVLSVICQKIWVTKEWPKEWMELLIIPSPKKGNFKQCQNYQTISHPSKIMLRGILSGLKAKAEELLAEEQVGLRPGWSTVEQIFNG